MLRTPTNLDFTRNALQKSNGGLAEQGCCWMVSSKNSTRQYLGSHQCYISGPPFISDCNYQISRRGRKHPNSSKMMVGATSVVAFGLPKLMHRCSTNLYSPICCVNLKILMILTPCQRKWTYVHIGYVQYM